jgi:hypothetical protein
MTRWTRLGLLPNAQNFRIDHCRRGRRPRSRTIRSFISVTGHDEGVNELVGIGDIPLLREEGWTRHQENGAKPLYLERTGWSLTSHVSGMHSENLCCERPPRIWTPPVKRTHVPVLPLMEVPD